MISVNTALSLLNNNIDSLNTIESKQLVHSLGHVLSEDVFSPINMPPFSQSAMDGYAINLHESKVYNVIGEVKAGDQHQLKLKEGEAIRIFTGSPVPESANAIVIQEKVMVNNKTIKIEEVIDLGANIRNIGEQVKNGDIALKKGTKLSPASVGFLISLGITEVKVYCKPNIAIVVTGNELIDAGQQLTHGKIYESNSNMLKTALEKFGYSKITIHKVDDNFNTTYNKLNEVINKNDMVLVSGGISVGDYDFVGDALQKLDVEQLFYKVNQKPGKPLFFGKKDKTTVFALPGNPAASLTCFYIYVLTALQIMSGHLEFSLNKVEAFSVSNFKKTGDRAQFLKAIYKNGIVEILESQNSSMLHTFAISNALVYLPEDQNEIKIKDKVETILLPLN
ncbi:molybdopterin molybdotransferase MoeA [Yeosuana sp. MJ-SS3]|uniref:Molybdopterin molybdenumtransferase n=1 Tax=Gilvirhabdus luticola TaxID=3079858 RepID=A0ABU3U4N7_9FLAO|nr:gephyrin-like molybdotransferase Glp [Yeosuana sp. MJ-SS3]MDU8885075.1 molybdopterin molybdotransferase MoeA [Yeosuana sp. MJ-SS3]